MAKALTNLQTEVARLQALSTQILAKTGGEDPALLQAEVEKIAAVNATFEAALTPPPTP